MADAIIETSPVAFIRAWEASPEGADLTFRIGADAKGRPVVVLQLERRTFGFLSSECRTLADIFADAVAKFNFTGDGLPDLIMALRYAADAADEAEQER